VTAPTATQTAAWEALQEAQSVSGAARLLGKNPEVVRSLIKAYMRNANIDGPVPFARHYRQQRTVELVVADRVATLEAQVARLRARLDLTEQRLAESYRKRFADRDHYEAQLRALRRPTPITHRRIADGGIGGKAERRNAA
jgi:hypothetical protein